MQTIEAKYLYDSVQQFLHLPDDADIHATFQTHFERSFFRLQNPLWYPRRTDESKRLVAVNIDSQESWMQREKEIIKEQVSNVADYLELDDRVALELVKDIHKKGLPNSPCFFGTYS